MELKKFNFRIYVIDGCQDKLRKRWTTLRDVSKLARVDAARRSQVRVFLPQISHHRFVVVYRRLVESNFLQRMA